MHLTFVVAVVVWKRMLVNIESSFILKQDLAYFIPRVKSISEYYRLLQSMPLLAMKGTTLSNFLVCLR